MPKFLYRLIVDLAFTVHDAWNRFSSIDGTMWAGAFAYNAFFSMFPAVFLTALLASIFLDRQGAADQVIDYMESYVPLTDDMKSYIFDTVSVVVSSRSQVSVVAMALLGWGAIQCFITLATAINRARGGLDYSWWRLPLKSVGLFMVVAIGILIGIGVPLVVNLLGTWFPVLSAAQLRIDMVTGQVLSPTIIFCCLVMMYRFAPRCSSSFRDIWVGALFATVCLRLGERGFGIYLRDFASFNALYGTFGGIMALLLWIYLSGCIFIFGACLRTTPDEQPPGEEPLLDAGPASQSSLGIDDTLPKTDSVTPPERTTPRRVLPPAP